MIFLQLFSLQEGCTETQELTQAVIIGLGKLLLSIESLCVWLLPSLVFLTVSFSPSLFISMHLDSLILKGNFHYFPSYRKVCTFTQLPLVIQAKSLFLLFFQSWTEERSSEDFPLLQARETYEVQLDWWQFIILLFFYWEALEEKICQEGFKFPTRGTCLLFMVCHE